MNITQISEHAFQLTRIGLVNCYLVRESDGFTLIDTTIPGSTNSILDAANRQGAPIKRVLLTHAHGDHIGSLDALMQALSNATVAISARNARMMPKPPAQDKSVDPGEPQCPLKGTFPGAATAPTHFVSDNELFGSLRAFATPGHTPGHFSFLDERDGTLYTGDAMVTMGKRPRIAGWAPWFFPLPNFGTWHRPTAKSSIERLLSVIPQQTPIRRLAAGHGAKIEGGMELLHAALKETA